MQARRLFSSTEEFVMANLATAKAAEPRFRVQSRQWGDHKRYALVDGRDDTVLAVRTSRIDAENELIVLTLNNREPDTQGVAPLATRICGRCRGEFPAARDQDVLTLTDWWLCDPCRDSLMGAAPVDAKRVGALPGSAAR
jgi:hypothetical protein